MSENMADAFVFFGAAGDLAYKQIFPALQALAGHDQLNMAVIGIDKAALNQQEFIARARASIVEHGVLDDKAFAKLSARLHYINGDYNAENTYQQLREALQNAKQPLHYFAIPPAMFATVIKGLSQAGCAKHARVIVEKPFGRDLASAQILNELLLQSFSESAIYRIDHFLGKEAVQNLLYFRFANAFMEPIWNHHYIESIQITMAESFGIQGRGHFYDGVGAIRDVVQNHLLQVIALLACEAPNANQTYALNQAKLAVFTAMQPIVPQLAVRGQVKGYCDEAGVAKNSQVETFVALRLNINNDRWNGVPFYIRTGKYLPLTATEVFVTLKSSTPALFDATTHETANYIRFRISPDARTSIGARIKMPGEKMAGELVELIAHHQVNVEKAPYERLLGDAIRGDKSLFATYESIAATWRVVAPILDQAVPLVLYDTNTWGPQTINQLMVNHDAWHNPALATDS